MRRPGAGLGFSEQQHLGVGFAQCLFQATEGHPLAVAVRKDHPAGCRRRAVDRRDGQTENCSQVQFKFTEVLTDQGDKTRVVGTRRQL